MYSMTLAMVASRVNAMISTRRLAAGVSGRAVPGPRVPSRGQASVPSLPGPLESLGLVSKQGLGRLTGFDAAESTVAVFDVVSTTGVPGLLVNCSWRSRAALDASKRPLSKRVRAASVFLSPLSGRRRGGHYTSGVGLLTLRGRRSYNLIRRLAPSAREPVYHFRFLFP